jgi:hypothetical protein
MSRTIQFRRLGTATLANTTGANGELIINNTNKTLTVHDGVTPGGYALLNSATDNNIDQIARNTANTATSDVIILQGVNATQNTNITAATNLAQAAFNQANTGSTDQYARDTANSKFSSSGGQITGNVIIVGDLDVTDNTIVSNAIEANNAIFDGTLLSGLAARSSVVLPHLIAQFASNSATYVQTNSQNINPEGSADWVVTADNGTDTDFYIDMGLHGSQAYDGIISPYDGYLYVQGSTIGQAGGNLIIGTTSSFPGLETMFVSGGYQYQNNIVMRIGSYGANVIGDLTVTGGYVTTGTSDNNLILTPSDGNVFIQLPPTSNEDINPLLIAHENLTGEIQLKANTNTWNFSADGNLTTPGNITTNILKIQDGVHETFQAKADATGVVTHDCSSGYIFNHTSIDNNFTANFTNLTLESGEATTITLVLNQGATAYIANAIQINSVSQTIKWSANTVPTGNANAVDVQSFSILNSSGTYTVLGQLSTFG